MVGHLVIAILLHNILFRDSKHRLLQSSEVLLSIKESGKSTNCFLTRFNCFLTTTTKFPFSVKGSEFLPTAENSWLLVTTIPTWFCHILIFSEGQTLSLSRNLLGKLFIKSLRNAV